jgi:hypothetical protein
MRFYPQGMRVKHAISVSPSARRKDATRAPKIAAICNNLPPRYFGAIIRPTNQQ